MHAPKEVPNTSGVVPWPDLQRQRDASSRHAGVASCGSVKLRGRGIERSSIPTDDEFDGPSAIDLWREWLEYYVFLILGSLVWYHLVIMFLDWHKFPYHFYTVEVCLVVAIPIVLILLLLNMMDIRFRQKFE